MQQVQAEVEAARKAVGEVEARKADRREVMELRQTVQNGLEAKAEVQEVQALVNRYQGEQTQRAFELRQELFKKVSEVQSLVGAGVGGKVGIEEFNEAMAQKADVSLVRTVMEQKVGYQDFE
jgi:hypothetical protein